LRARWVAHVPLGFVVMPARWTHRVWTSMKNQTYSRVRTAVSTVKKPQANAPAA
jgi:hypothetical protein